MGTLGCFHVRHKARTWTKPKGTIFFLHHNLAREICQRYMCLSFAISDRIFSNACQTKSHFVVGTTTKTYEIICNSCRLQSSSSLFVLKKRAGPISSLLVFYKVISSHLFPSFQRNNYYMLDNSQVKKIYLKRFWFIKTNPFCYKPFETSTFSQLSKCSKWLRNGSSKASGSKEIAKMGRLDKALCAFCARNIMMFSRLLQTKHNIFSLLINKGPYL